jgi:hypothetical protein
VPIRAVISRGRRDPRASVFLALELSYETICRPEPRICPAPALARPVDGVGDRSSAMSLHPPRRGLTERDQRSLEASDLGPGLAQDDAHDRVALEESQ